MALNPLESQAVVSCRVGAENPTQVLCMSRKFSLLSRLSSPTAVFLKMSLELQYEVWAEHNSTLGSVRDSTGQQEVPSVSGCGSDVPSARRTRRGASGAHPSHTP